MDIQQQYFYAPVKDFIGWLAWSLIQPIYSKDTEEIAKLIQPHDFDPPHFTFDVLPKWHNIDTIQQVISSVVVLFKRLQIAPGQIGLELNSMFPTTTKKNHCCLKSSSPIYCNIPLEYPHLSLSHKLN